MVSPPWLAQRLGIPLPTAQLLLEVLETLLIKALAVHQQVAVLLCELIEVLLVAKVARGEQEVHIAQYHLQAFV